MMRLYILDMNEVTYDQYRFFVVCAQTEERVVGVIKRALGGKHDGFPAPFTEANWKAGYTITYLGNLSSLTEEEIVRACLNYG